MSWVKLDDAAYEHTKLLAVGAAASWLWVCGLSYCNRQKRRDGFIPLTKVALLYPGVGPKQAKRLVDAGLWESTSGGFLIHGYHEYQPSEEFSELQSVRGAIGGSVKSEAKRQAAIEREAKRRKAQAEAEAANHKPASANRPQQPQASPGPARPDPGPREKIPLPPTEPARPKPADPMAAAFLPIGEDIARIHERWKLSTGLTGHRLKSPTSLDSMTLREAIDAHGESECLLVAEACMRDRMVNGEADERGLDHRSIGYVFGNETAFARILKAAQDSKPPAAVPAEDPFEAAMRATPP